MSDIFPRGAESGEYGFQKESPGFSTMDSDPSGHTSKIQS